MKRIHFLLLLLPALFLSCSEPLHFAPQEDRVVVEAYLYAGEPIADFRLASTIGLGSVDTLAPPINDAQVQLIKNNICYVLTPWNSKGYYTYSERIYTPYDCPTADCIGENTLSIMAGDHFRLEVLYYDKVASAETVVPEKAKNLRLNADGTVIFISPSSYTGDWQTQPGGLFVDDSVIAATFSWEDDGRSWYYVTLENTDIIPELIDPSSSVAYPGKFVSNPFTGGNFPIGMKNFTHYGRHRFTVYSINREYVNLYLSRNQDTRDLNEPLSNMENGLGIFTAFNTTKIDFYVEPQ